MGKTFQSGIISRLVVGGGTYAVLHGETQIDVDNSNGLPTIIKLQPIDPSLGQCTVYINDYGNNSSVGNITIVASGGNLINGQPTLVLDTDGIGAEISVADQKSFIASLNNDSQGGGGSITGAFNGLSVSGTNIILGGALTMPTTIDALGSNTFSINDQAGLMFKTRDALGNFFFNNIGGTGTLVGSSQYIFSYLGDGGNVFTDSLIVINFGGANNFTQAVDFWNFGDYTQANISSSIFNIGRFNHFDNVSSTTVMGYSNDLNAVYSSTILGSGNTYSGLNQKFILGNNNNNLIIDGVTGILNSNATYNNTSFAPLNNIVGVDMNGDFYNTGLNASAVLTGAGLPNYVSKWTSGSDLTISQLFDNGTDVGINTITPSAKLHLKGIDATSFNYALKVDNSASSPLLYVRNDGKVGIGTSTPSAKLDVNGQVVAGLGGGVVTANDSPFYAVRANAGSPNYYSGFQYVFEVGGGVWGIGMNYANNEFQFLTNGASTGKFIFGYGNPTTPNGKFIMDLNGGYFGANTTSPTATIHAKGIDSTASNYALKIDNSAFTHLLYVKNDGEIEMNGFTIRQLSNYTIFKTSGTNGYLFNNSSDSTNLARLTDSGVLILNQVASQNPNVQLSVQSNSTGNLIKESIAELFKKTTNNTGILVSAKEGVSYIQGTTSANGQKVDLIMGGYDGAGNQLESLFLKNNGVIAMPTLQVGNVGLVSGDLYVDTSANILANGDLVVGRKV